jgi:hypothetical protein
MIASKFRLARVRETLHLATTESLTYHFKTLCRARGHSLLGSQPGRCDMNLLDLNATAGFVAYSSEIPSGPARVGADMFESGPTLSDGKDYNTKLVCDLMDF